VKAVSANIAQLAREELEAAIEGTPINRPGEVDDAMLQKIRNEFVDLPGLRLTAQQAKRVWELDESNCRRLLATLVEKKFLRQNEHGSYLQSPTGAVCPQGLQAGRAPLKEVSLRQETFLK